MGKDSKIEWTHHTFNPWWGCTKISPGCAHCYAEGFAKRTGHQIWGDDAPRRYFNEKHFLPPLAWNNAADETGLPQRIFCGSMCDWAEGRDEQLPHLARLFDLIDRTIFLDWQLLTKRPENILPILKKLVAGDLSPWARQLVTDWLAGLPPKNVWLLTSVEHHGYLHRAVDLAKVPAVVHGLSCEPLLGEIEINLLPKDVQLDWIIAGGESGSGARPMHPDWARSLRDQCAAAGVPFFFKQWGEWSWHQGGFGDGGERQARFVKEGPFPAWMVREGKKAAGHLLDGVEHHAFPIPRSTGILPVKEPA